MNNLLKQYRELAKHLHDEIVHTYGVDADEVVCHDNKYKASIAIFDLLARLDVATSALEHYKGIGQLHEGETKAEAALSKINSDKPLEGE